MVCCCNPYGYLYLPPLRIPPSVLALLPRALKFPLCFAAFPSFLQSSRRPATPAKLADLRSRMGLANLSGLNLPAEHHSRDLMQPWKWGGGGGWGVVLVFFSLLPIQSLRVDDEQRGRDSSALLPTFWRSCRKTLVTSQQLEN